MDSYNIEWNPSALKELRRLPKEIAGRIFKVVEELASNPFPNKVRKLAESDNSFRIRVGDYRVLYKVISKTLIVEIVRAGHRRDAYRQTHRLPFPRVNHILTVCFTSNFYHYD